MTTQLNGAIGFANSPITYLATRPVGVGTVVVTRQLVSGDYGA